jgi:hypothetical protein
MVCFSVDIVLQIPKRSNVEALERRVAHLMHHCNADYTKQKQTENLFFYNARICDEDAVTLLRDFPTPFNVQCITLLHTGETLYLYRKHHNPPPILLYKKIYWLAKSTERWKGINDGQNTKGGTLPQIKEL